MHGLFGTPGPDLIRLGPAGILGAGINYGLGLEVVGTDDDIDVPSTTPPV